MRALQRTLALAIAGTAAVGCGPAPPEQTATGAADGAPAIGAVEVSNEPLAYVVERLAGHLVEIRFRAADAPDPAHWRPSAEEVLAMQDADLIVLNGASYEGWLKDVSLPTSRVVDTTAAVRERLIAFDQGVTHSHGLEGEHEHTGTAFTTWLDPTLLAEQARAVRTALGSRWPEHDGLFGDRLAALEADLEALDGELESAFAGLGEAQLVFSHPVYQYLERRYGLVGDSVHWEPDAAPGDPQWAELDHILGHGPVKWMVWEAEPLAETSGALAERGIGVIVLEPCATPPGDGDFLGVMHGNAGRIEAAAAP